VDKPRRTWRHRFYIKDAGAIALSLIVLLGGLYIYAAFFSHLLQNLVLGPDPSEDQLYFFNVAVGRSLICVFPVTVIALIALLLYAIEAVFGLRKRKPLSCPRCGMVDGSSTMRFVQEPIVGTEWKNVRCPQCGYDWHVRR
jgi:ribosomal protein S27AE